MSQTMNCSTLYAILKPPTALLIQVYVKRKLKITTVTLQNETLKKLNMSNRRCWKIWNCEYRINFIYNHFNEVIPLSSLNFLLLSFPKTNI